MKMYYQDHNFIYEVDSFNVLFQIFLGKIIAYLIIFTVMSLLICWAGVSLGLFQWHDVVLFLGINDIFTVEYWISFWNSLLSIVS